MKQKIDRVLILTHGDPQVAAAFLEQSLHLLTARGVDACVPASEWHKHAEVFARVGSATLIDEAVDLEGVGLCLVLGGDGSMLRGFHLTRGWRIPVAGVNLGRVGFLTTVVNDDLIPGLIRLLEGDFVEYPLLGLEAQTGSTVAEAINDVVVTRGDSPHACSFELTINGVKLFEVMGDGIVVATPAGSSAYSLAAGGPLLGISVQAYVISLLAPHAVGVRPVVAAPGDYLEITNTDHELPSYVDIDGRRTITLEAGMTLRVKTSPGLATLALLEGDSLYHHFRDRLL